VSCDHYGFSGESRQYIRIDTHRTRLHTCQVNSKTSQLQIRVSPAQKDALKRLAAEAGLTVSAYVLAVALPPVSEEFTRRIRALTGAVDRHKQLWDLTIYLSSLPDAGFVEAVAVADFAGIPPLLQNYAAASVEQEASRRGLAAPAWTESIENPVRPHFAWELRSLRPHLMRMSPPAFKRRNLYVPAPDDRRQ